MVIALLSLIIGQFARPALEAPLQALGFLLVVWVGHSGVPLRCVKLFQRTPPLPQIIAEWRQKI
jgi:hypothetical protein